MPEDVSLKTPCVSGFINFSIRACCGIRQRHMAVKVLLIQLTVGCVVYQGKQPRYSPEVPDPTLSNY